MPISANLAGCGAPPINPNVSAMLTISEILPGPHRFPFRLVDTNGTAITGAEVHASFFQLREDVDHLRFQTYAAEQTITTTSDHIHSDSSIHEHSDTRSYYLVSDGAFEEGLWRSDLEVQPPNGSAYSLSTAFQVLSNTNSPNVGERIPSSINPTASGFPDLSLITTAVTPEPGMYEFTVTAVLAAGDPLVVAFSTPAFCRSRMCGPVTAVVTKLYKRWSEHVRFVHIEPFNLSIARTAGRLELTDIAGDWNIRTEPWVFVIDRNGRVSARFEGTVGEDELEPAIATVASHR
jgi:hypothetical protein